MKCLFKLLRDGRLNTIEIAIEEAPGFGLNAQTTGVVSRGRQEESNGQCTQAPKQAVGESLQQALTDRATHGRSGFL